MKLSMRRFGGPPSEREQVLAGLRSGSFLEEFVQEVRVSGDSATVSVAQGPSGSLERHGSEWRISQIPGAGTRGGG